jgi:hypothetical protein
MFCRGKTILLYMFITFITLLFMIYIWRRIYTLECYSQILQKKLSNARKENKELQSLIKSNNINTCSLDEAEVIMNKIFMDDICCEKGICVKKDTVNDVKIVISDMDAPVADHVTSNQDSPSDTIVLPVAQHDSDNDRDIDIESILSDVTGTAYTRKKLVKMNLEKLKEICTSMNLPTDGTKNMLIDKILLQ